MVIAEREQAVIDQSENKIIELIYQEIYDHKANIYKWFKRCFDIVASGVALILLSPIFVLTALAILMLLAITLPIWIMTTILPRHR